MTTATQENGTSIWASGLILAVLAALCTALVSFTHRVTTIQIIANEQAYLEQSLARVLAEIPYTNKLSDSTIIIQPPHELPGAAPAIIYRAYHNSDPVAALFVVTAREGFTGPIKLLIGISMSNHITSVRILEHRETPGLGDLIESSKSDWIKQFRDASLESPVEDDWSIKRDGGVFDQLTGASVTPRAVIKAVKSTLQYFEANRDTIFAPNKQPEGGSSE